MTTLAPTVVTQIIGESIMVRIEAGELRAVVDSPNDWE